MQLTNTYQLGLPSAGALAARSLTQVSYSSASHRHCYSISELFCALSFQQRRCYADNTYTQAAKDLNQKGLDEQESKLDEAIAQEKEKQQRTPWHREGSAVPPVQRQRSAGAMTKGKSASVSFYTNHLLR